MLKCRCHSRFQLGSGSTTWRQTFRQAITCLEKTESTDLCHNHQLLARKVELFDRVSQDNLRETVGIVLYSSSGKSVFITPFNQINIHWKYRRFVSHSHTYKLRSVDWNRVGTQQCRTRIECAWWLRPPQEPNLATLSIHTASYPV